MRVLAVDDHRLFRAGLAAMLRERGIEVVGEADSGEEALRLAAARRPDVVVMDLGLPGMSGVEATRRLRDERPAPQVVVLTASLEEDDVVEALLAGAAGYLLKDAPIDQVLTALSGALDGEAFVSPRVNRQLVERLRAAHRPEPVALGLSSREHEVLALVVEGCDNAEIARRLYVSPSTVKHHLSTIFTKLGVDNRIQAAVRAVRAGLG
jgi:DNA-binding NarL/FixJ family response regulator